MFAASDEKGAFAVERADLMPVLGGEPLRPRRRLQRDPDHNGKPYRAARGRSARTSTSPAPASWFVAVAPFVDVAASRSSARSSSTSTSRTSSASTAAATSCSSTGRRAATSSATRASSVAAAGTRARREFTTPPAKSAELRVGHRSSTGPHFAHVSHDRFRLTMRFSAQPASQDGRTWDRTERAGRPLWSMQTRFRPRSSAFSGRCELRRSTRDHSRRLLMWSQCGPTTRRPDRADVCWRARSSRTAVQDAVTARV